jgi:hypothetical protein
MDPGQHAVDRRDRSAAAAGSPARRRPDPGPTAQPLLQLQSAAGNAAVNALLSGRGPGMQRLAAGTIPPPPVAPAPPVPSEHPGYRAAQAKITAVRRNASRHPPAGSKVAESAKAAQPPADAKESQAKTAKAAEMEAAPVPAFDKAAFIKAVGEAIARATPQTLDDADKFASSGAADAIAGQVKETVEHSKEATAKPMADASQKPPDTSKATDKPVTPIPPQQPPATPVTDFASAMPAKAPAEQTNLGNGPAETNAMMAEAGVTEEQLAKSNEPEFTGALAAKKEGEEHSRTAPATVREFEAGQLATSRQDAQAAGSQGVASMIAAQTTGQTQVRTAQTATQARDEQKLAEVSGRVKSIFDATKTEVDAILSGLDALVDKEFTEGERRAKQAFTADVAERMDRYKTERYSGPTGWARWTADLILSLPPEVNQFYQAAKKLYESEMTKVISSVADLIGRELTRAKERVANGRQEISAYVNTLEPGLKAIGRQAATQIGAQFDSLTESITEKGQSLAEDVAQKYVEAGQAVDDEITKMQEENKGLWDKAKDAAGGAVETILKLKNMLLGVLARAAGAVEKIIKDPIGFLGNFVNAVKAGVMNFGSNILQHLKKGLQSWLFGALADAGIEIPEKFDLKGIVGLILSLLGLTWASIRARLAKVLPEWVIKALETAVEAVKILTTEGAGGLWKWIVEEITDLKDQVMSQIKDFVITKIITAGITWLISLLNPAAAFIKACKMIYDAVIWFVDNAERLKDFVDSVLDSVESIAAGGVGKVAALIEATLGKAVPMVISGLASLLGLGGIADKIKQILETIQKPVGKVVDSIIAGVIKYGKKLLGKLKPKKKPEDETPDVKQKRLDDGLNAAASTVNRLSGRFVPKKLIDAALVAVRIRYRMTELRVVEEGRRWKIVGKVNPEGERPTTKEAAGGIDYAAPPASDLAALGLGRDAIDRIFAKRDVNQAQGQILEEIAAKRHAGTTPDQAQAAGSESHAPEFVAPHEISSDGSLSDGMTVILGTDATGPWVQILSIVESKAGKEAKRELARVREPWSKASAADRAEARRQAIDDLVEQSHPELESLPPSDHVRLYASAKADVLATHSQEDLERLAKRRFEGSEFLGQPAQDLERLAPNVDTAEGSQREIPAVVTIRGVPRRVKGFSRSGIAVHGVIPAGVPKGRTEQDVRNQSVTFVLEQEGITMERIRTLATAVVAAGTARSA